MYLNMCIHIHLFSLLYTYKCTYLLVYIYVQKYISHLRTRTHTHIYIYTYHMYIYIYIYISSMHIYIYLCLDDLNQLARACSIALSQTIGQSLQRSLKMAQEQKNTRRKEQKAPKNTSCPRAARPVSLPEGTHHDKITETCAMVKLHALYFAMISGMVIDPHEQGIHMGLSENRKP